MNYKIKLFGGTPDRMESEINKWLEEHDVEVIQIIPCLAMTSVPIQSGPVSPLHGPASMSQVHIQNIQAVTVTIVYKEKPKVKS